MTTRFASLISSNFLINNNPGGRYWRLISSSQGGSVGAFRIFDQSAGGADRLFITSSGRIGIGSTNPGGQLHVSTNGGINELILNRNAAAAPGTGLIVGRRNEVNKWQVGLDGSDNFYVNMLGHKAVFEGNVQVIGSLTETSSRRWKTNIASIEGALDKVQRLRGVTYDWKADGRHHIGLIAEEVGEVLPEVVSFEENGIDAQSVQYSRLVAVLIEGMKEQQAQIEALSLRLVELEE